MRTATDPSLVIKNLLFEDLTGVASNCGSPSINGNPIGEEMIGSGV